MSILKKYIEDHKKMVIAGTVSIAVIGVSIMTWLGIRKNAYVVSVEGKVVGIIKTKEQAQSAYDKVVADIDGKVNIPFVMNETLEVEAVHASSKELTSYEDLAVAINEAVSYNVEAYEILVDEKSYAVVHTKEEAATIIEKIATRFAPNNGTVTLDIADKEKMGETVEEATEEGQVVVNDNVLTSNDTSNEHTDEVSKVTISNVEKGEEDQTEEEVDEEAQAILRTLQSYDFNEEITIKSCFIEEEKILSKEEAENILAGDFYEIVDYQLVEGDNIWDIAVAFDTTQERILELNPEIQDETTMQIGQVIKVEKAIPILSITTVEESTFKELIPGEIQYKPSQQFYEGFTKVIVEGNDGVKELTVEVTKVNGEEVSRTTLSEKVLTEAKVTVIAYGVKEKEEESQSSSGSTSSGSSNQSTGNNGSSSNNSGSSGNYSSGTYIHPLKGAGTISSGYGSRWGTYHYGLDFAASAGTPIYASRGGKVIYSAYNNGGYGKLVIIEHSDGTQTYYAHCSSLYVQVGETVSQGEKIAGVGTTGNSTGNHLHFEIRINGRPVNPANYL